MKKKHLNFWGIGLIFVGIMVLFSTKAIAVGTLITLSSASYNNNDNWDFSQDVTADNDGNIIVTGHSLILSYFDFFTVKYNSNLVFISSVTYDGGVSDYAYGIATDNNNNIIVSGRSGNGLDDDYFTIKYDPNLAILSSVTYDGYDFERASGLVIDSNNNIFITGTINNGSDDDYFTIKYDNDLVPVSSVTYDGGGTNDYACGITIDSNNNIIVTGYKGDTGSSDYFTIKYNSNMVVLSSVAYDGGSCEEAHGVAVDRHNNVFVTGISSNIVSGSDFFTIKYDSNLIFISSATYNGNVNGNDGAWGITVDNNDNIIVVGYRYNGSDDDYFTIKYDSNLIVLSSATYSGHFDDIATGIAVDKNDNIIITGRSDNGLNDDYFTIKYNGPPMISSIFPAYRKRGKTIDVTINGLNFYPGIKVAFSGSGLIVNSINFISSTQLSINITIAENASLGMRNITVTNIDEASVTVEGGFEVRALEMVEVGVKIQGGEKGYANPAKGEEATIHFRTSGAGEIKIKIYTLKGQLVCEKSKQTYGEEDSIIWDCKNSDGTVVSSGIYVLHIDAPGIDITKKIAIIK